MNAQGRRSMQGKVGYRGDPPPESASQICDAWQTFSAHALRDRRSISLPTGEKRVAAVRSLTHPIGVGADVTIS
ncbi:hypothetical protein LMG27952_01061 [Paraburkholderia hiiakae]|uniref:Uncharacterized protein n=1 Tax=Paraburkholderia hiiakae TaxID=1081782 RepID=A0ABM8NDQ1_9BURK|nr:hypothetical protein LMG27952_01061 [Paraburkholderia hiiakae]